MGIDPHSPDHPDARAAPRAGGPRASMHCGMPRATTREIAMNRPRFGYERIHIVLRREGWWRRGATRLHAPERARRDWACESFNCRLREKCLNVDELTSLEHTRTAPSQRADGRSLRVRRPGGAGHERMDQS